MVNCLRLMRTKNVITVSAVVPVLFKLFRCKDKNLRTTITSNIVSDLKFVNKNRKCPKVNKSLQNFVFEMVKDPDEKAAKRSLIVMIELYKRKVWNDENTVLSLIHI